MKNLKRIIALVAVFALALTTFVSAASFTDVAEDSVYYRAVEQLHKIGIIDGYTDGTFKPEQTVTRAEMAKLIAAMQGYAESAEGKSATKFSDVPSTHWASGYIASATGTGIDGLPDGTFAPERNVKYEEAVKMIMATLGYTVIANAEGGYPMGYISAAIKEKVTEDVTGANIGSEASRGTIAQLIYNAIDTPLVEQISWNKDGSGDFVKYDGNEYTQNGQVITNAWKSLMTENLGIIKGVGVVTDNSYFGLNHDGSIDLDEALTVDIAVDFNNTSGPKDYRTTFQNGEDVLVGESDAMDYVGMAVDFYAMENEYEEWEILSIIEHEVFNKTVTFNLADYDEKESAKADANVIYYFKDGAANSTKVVLQDGSAKDSSAYSVMYNFVAYNKGIKSLLSTLKAGNFGGQVTLIDNDKFAGYDAVIVEAAVSGVVEEVKRGRIAWASGSEPQYTTDAGNGSIRIDATSEDTLFVFMKDGEVVEADTLVENDVVSFLGQKNGGYAIVEVMSNVVEGSVGSTKSSKTSADGKAYKLDGTWYDVAAGAESVMAGIEAGDMGTFYIDKYGKIAYFVDGGTFAGNFAYVLDAMVDIDDWGNLSFAMKLLTKDGVAVYSAASKVTLNDTDKNTSETVDVKANTGNKVATFKTENNKKVIDTLGVDGTALVGLKNTVIDFALSNGTVKKITTAGYAKVNGNDPDFKAVSIANGIYDAEDFAIGNKDLDEDTIVFYFNSDTPEASYVGTLAELEDKDSLTVLGAYAVTKKVDNDANIVVLKDATSKASISAGLAVVTDFETGSNDDEEDIFTVTMLYNGEEITAATTADVYDDYKGNLSTGDIVKVKVSGAGLITAMEPVFDFSNDDVRPAGEALDIVAAFAYNGKTLNDVVPADDTETIAAGYILDFSKSSKKAGILIDKDGKELNKVDGNYIEYSLSKCDNVYVIDGTGRNLDIYAGSAGDYTYDTDLLNDKKNPTGFAAAGTFDAKKATGANYADVVVFRTFDGDVVEAVIIKGDSEYKFAEVKNEGGNQDNIEA